MLSGHCDHAGLRALLEFESTRLELPIRVRHIDLQWNSLDARREELGVLVHDGVNAVDFGLHLDGGVHHVSSPLWLPPDDTPVFGPVDEHGQVQPLVSVVGHNVAVHIPPRCLGGCAVRVLGPCLEEALARARKVFEERVLSAETDRYMALKERTWSSRLELRRQAAYDAEMSVLRLEEDLRSRYRNLAELKEELRLLEIQVLPAVRRNGRNELDRLRKMVPRALQAVRVSDGRLLITTHAVSIEHEGYTYELGRFEININVRRSVIRIHSLDGGKRGYPHPHVNSGGEPCLGSMAGPISSMLGEGDLFGVVVGLQEYLASYNPASPYLEIDFWNPDYDDSARWDRCYEDVGPRDCVTCDESECPHREGAADACWELSDSYNNCIECRDCGWANEAQDRCRDDHSPQECFACSLELCSYAADPDACCDEHDGDDCAGCEHDSCRHWAAANNEEEEE